MAEAIVVNLPDEAATLSLGASLSKCSGIIFLNGELGAGKTTMVRGFLQALGYQGAVKSPTYTLIDPYEIAGRRILHLDIYRLGDPSELEALAIRDELGADNTLLIEWPSKTFCDFSIKDLMGFDLRGIRRSDLMSFGVL